MTTIDDVTRNKTLRLYLKRSWLNPSKHIDTGHMKSEVSIITWESKGKTYCEIDAEFTLADCYKTVTINLFCLKKKDALDRIRKLDLMMEHLQGIRSAIENNIELLR